MSEEELFCRRPMGMRMAMIVRQWRAVIDDAILDHRLNPVELDGDDAASSARG